MKLTVLLHNRQELNDNLGRRTDENLSLTTAFSVVDVVQTIVQDGDSDHFKSSINNELGWMNG
jgi:hypothetical protein